MRSIEPTFGCVWFSKCESHHAQGSGVAMCDSERTRAFTDA